MSLKDPLFWHATLEKNGKIYQWLDDWGNIELDRVYRHEKISEKRFHLCIQNLKERFNQSHNVLFTIKSLKKLQYETGKFRVPFETVDIEISKIKLKNGLEIFSVTKNNYQTLWDVMHIYDFMQRRKIDITRSALNRYKEESVKKVKNFGNEIPNYSIF